MVTRGNIEELRLAANRVATALIAGKVSVEEAVNQFVEEVDPHLVSALGLRPANEYQNQD